MPSDECPVCFAVSPLGSVSDANKPGAPLLCPKCASVVTRDESGNLREPLIKEMLLWDQNTHNTVSFAQECIRKGGRVV